MTLLEEDLLAALKELLISSEIMANGTPASEDAKARYYQSTEWAKRAISHADDNERFQSSQVKHH